MRIYVRRVRLSKAPKKLGVPLIMVHGGAAGSAASFDLNVPGYSLAVDIARAGHTVYLIDVRGFGNSTNRRT